MIYGMTEGLDRWWIHFSYFDGWWAWGFFLFWAFLFGGCMGSFLNVCVWWIPRGESIVDQPSHCPVCGALIRWYDNVPFFAYLNLRGRCRNCKTHIPIRYLLMEAVVGLLFAGLLAKAGWSEQSPAVLLLYFPMASLAFTTFLIDARHRIIPDLTTYPAMAAGVLFSALVPAAWGMQHWYWSGLYSLGSLAAVGIFLGAFAWIGGRIAGRDVLGWGDVKFMMACGALLGIPGALFTLFTGSLMGTVYGAVLWNRRRKKGRRRRLSIPFGPFLAVGSVLWMLIGEKCLKLYLQLLMVQ